MSSRWGKPYHDHRDWRTYNEQLVVRGEFYLDFDFLLHWAEELGTLNEGKRGGQYRIPESFVRWLVLWKQFLDYRALEGIARQFAREGYIPLAPDYTTIWYRVHGLKPALRMPEYTDLEAGTDGTGLKTTNAGEYRIFRYGDPDAQQKKHLVVVITADVRRKKVLGLEVHIEGKGHSEPKTGAQHVEELTARGYRVRKFYGDGAFDTKGMFSTLKKTGTEAVIKIGKDATATPRNYDHAGKARRKEIRGYRKLGYEKWSKMKGYGMRWPGTEGIFSAVKRKYGENVVARSPKGLVAEGYQRIWAYDELREYGETHPRPGLKVPAK
jgi:hypothetical protein